MSVVDRFYRSDYEESSRSVFEYDGESWSIRETPNSPPRSFTVEDSDVGCFSLEDFVIDE